MPPVDVGLVYNLPSKGQQFTQSALQYFVLPYADVLIKINNVQVARIGHSSPFEAIGKQGIPYQVSNCPRRKVPIR